MWPDSERRIRQGRMSEGGILESFCERICIVDNYFIILILIKLNYNDEIMELQFWQMKDALFGI